MDDLVVRVLSRLVDGGVRSGELGRDGRALRWAEAGSGVPAVVLDAALGEPGSLAFAGVMPLVAPRARVLAYDRAGIGASDPVSPLTLAIQVADLAALAREAGGGCVLAGHSWGAMLAQLVTLSHPELAAGLVLIDPAEEDLLASLPPEDREQEINSGQEVLDEYASGALPASIRELFGPFARGLTDDERLRALILDAYVSCYAEQSQVQVVADEKRLMFDYLTEIRRTRSRGLPDMPVVVFSATKHRSGEQRELWTSLHAKLAASVPRGEHIVLPGTSHAVNQERPAEIAAAINRTLDQIRSRP
jgi:pimeloyl-ACP methyl ester carboxylesterase